MPNDRKEVIEKLQSVIKNASTNIKIAKKVEAEKGDFKVIVTPTGIEHYYKSEPVSIIKTSELDDDVIELINSDSESAIQSILSTFAENFDTNSLVKKAANEVVNDETSHTVTEKQLAAKLQLHPRQEKHHTVTTDKQLSDDGQRPGTYDLTTEAQLRDERSTFYGEARTSGDWKDEDRDTVTEGQLSNEPGASERGEIGSKFDGGTKEQSHMTGTKQLVELLKHETWTRPNTTTEGSDQLGKQEGELARLTAESANKIIKESLSALGKTVAALCVVPDKVAEIVGQLVSHESKYTPLANLIKESNNKNVAAIESRVHKARHFGKAANASQTWSDELTADVIIRQLAQIKEDPRHIVNGLKVLSDSKNLADKISESFNSVLNSSTNPQTKTASVSGEDLFKQAMNFEVIADDAGDKDGKFLVQAHVSDVSENPENKDAFAKAAFQYAVNQVKTATNKNINLIASTFEVNEDGNFSITLFDTASDAGKQMVEKQARRDARRELLKESATSDCTCGKDCSCHCKSSGDDCSCTKEASVNASVKTAQMPGGGGAGGGMGGMGGGAAGGMGSPTPPPTGGDMNQPPLESFTEDPAGESEAGMTGEPKPPGSFCDACGSEDTDVDNGKIRCNNCGAEGDISVNIHWTKFPGVLEDTNDTEQEGDEKGIGLGEEEGAEPTADLGAAGNAGSGTTMPNVPVAASIRITPRMLEKLAAQKIELGKVCPNCGSSNTHLAKSASSNQHEGVCLDCYQEWDLTFTTNKKTKTVKANFAWLPKSGDDCPDCSRASSLKKDFIVSLANYGMNWSEFDALPDLKQQGDLILKMASSKTLNINENDTTVTSQIQKFASTSWNGTKKYASFPVDSCKERLSRRFGENATCMSGPCKGKSLSDCVCAQLKNFDVYSDGLAAKVASLHMSEDKQQTNPTASCINMFVKKFNYDVDDACVACKGLRAAYASVEDLTIEKIAQFNPMQSSPSMSAPKPMAAPMGASPMGASPMSPKPMAGPSGMPPAMGPKPMSDLDVADPTAETVSNEIPPTEESSVAGPIDNVEVVEISEPMGGEMGGHEPMIGAETSSMGPEMGDMVGLGGGDDVALNLGNAIMEAITEVLHGGGDKFISDQGSSEMPGSDITDVGGIKDEGFSDSGEGETEELGGDSGISDSEGSESGESEFKEEGVDDSEIPGLAEEKEESTGVEGLFKHDESQPEEKHEESESHESEESENKNPFSHEDSEEKSEESESKDMRAKPCCASVTASALDDLLKGMKKGTIGSNAGRSASIDAMIDGLLKQAAKKQDDIQKIEYKDAKETKLKDKPAQDSWKEEFSGKGGSTIGSEEKFKAEKPDIARGEAKLEGETITVSDSDRPSIPSSTGKLKEEKGIQKPEKQDEVDPNQGGTATVANSFKVVKSHNLYPKLKAKLASGTKTVTLTDGKTYSIKESGNDLILSKITKNAGEKELSRNDKAMQEDKDIGKVQEDKVHSRSKDEKKPSEGMKEPEVPEAPNGGQLTKEHTYDNKLDLPKVPSGGGVTEMDKEERYHPEKQESIRGQVSSVDSSASYNEAVKIAGLMLKQNKITAEELPSKIQQLSSLDEKTLNDYKAMLTTKATTEKGMKKESSLDAVESIVQNPSDSAEDRSELKTKLQSMFRLDRQNRDFESFKEEKGNPTLWR